MDFVDLIEALFDICRNHVHIADVDHVERLDRSTPISKLYPLLSAESSALLADPNACQTGMWSRNRVGGPRRPRPARQGPHVFQETGRREP